MWRQIALQVGDGRGWADMLATVDFDAASNGAIRMVFPTSRIGGRYFHLGQSVYRRAQRLGLQGQYEMGEGFRLMVKMMAATAFLPDDDIGRAFGELSMEFAEDELDLMRCFQRTYVGEVVGKARREPLFGFGIWGV